MPYSRTNQGPTPTIFDILEQGTRNVNNAAESIGKTLDAKNAREHDMEKLQKENELKQASADYERKAAKQQQIDSLATAQNYIDSQKGPNKRSNISLGANGAVTLGGGESDQMDQMLKALSLKNLNDDRNDRKIERLQDDVTKSGAPQAAESLKRVNKAIPGAFEGKATFKSAGGWKNVVPNFAVPIAEKFGVLEKGSGDERAALQEAQNAKIYDSSGKQINEAEMKRIADGMGLRGFFNPSALNDALKQVGDTVLHKNQNITAGYPEQTVNTFKGRGGVAAKNLQELLGKQNPLSSPSPQAPQQQQPALSSEEQEYLMLRKKHKGF